VAPLFSMKRNQEIRWVSAKPENVPAPSLLKPGRSKGGHCTPSRRPNEKNLAAHQKTRRKTKVIQICPRKKKTQEDKRSYCWRDRERTRQHSRVSGKKKGRRGTSVVEVAGRPNKNRPPSKMTKQSALLKVNDRKARASSQYPYQRNKTTRKGKEEGKMSVAARLNKNRIRKSRRACIARFLRVEGKKNKLAAKTLNGTISAVVPKRKSKGPGQTPKAASKNHAWKKEVKRRAR